MSNSPRSIWRTGMVVLIILLVILVKLLAAFLGIVGIPSGVFIAVLVPLIALLWQRGRPYDSSTSPMQRQEQTPPTLPPPGWHLDPSAGQIQRYWGGHPWTASMPPPQQYATGEIPPRNPTM